MKSHFMLTLFSSYPARGERSAPLVLSVLIHGFTFVAISLILIRAPRIVTPQHEDGHSARYLDIAGLELQLRRLSAAQARWQHEPAEKHHSAALAEQLSAYLHPAANIPKGKVSPQTLLQADLPKQVDAAIELPLPQVVIWKPRPASAKSITAPLPEMHHASDAIPSIVAPNDESQLATISLAATNLPANSGQTPAASTTPVSVHEPVVAQKPPVTLTQTSDKPTPVAVMSLSDLRMVKGRIVLPPVSESPGGQPQDGTSTNHAATPSRTVIGTDGRTNTNHKGQGSIDEPATEEASTDIRSEQPDAPFSKEGNSALGTEHNPSATLITLPRNGQFAAVIVGTSSDDRFADIERRWSGRLIYTVYLHVGLAHSWILQYSLPRSTEAMTAGGVNHLDAPWPYDMVRPDLDFSSTDADALILNGVITQDGTFEKLSLVSPPSFPEYDFVVRCLLRWKFRPAAEDGHVTPVEVMLIIPAPLI